MHLRIEFFVEDPERSRHFYTSVLGFSVVRQKADGFTELNRGAATLAINDRRILHPYHPTRPAAGERIGKVVEVVLVTESLRELYDQVRASGGRSPLP